MPSQNEPWRSAAYPPQRAVALPCASRTLWLIDHDPDLVARDQRDRPISEIHTLIAQLHDTIRKRTRPNPMPGSRTRKQPSLIFRFGRPQGHLCGAMQSRSLGQTVRSRGRLRNSNSLNGKIPGARSFTFSKHDCSVRVIPRRCYQICVVHGC